MSIGTRDRDTRTLPVGRWKPYPEYKESGIEWLGKIPAHWMTAAISRQFSIVNGATPSSSESGYWDGDIPWVTPEDLGRLTTAEITATARCITDAGYSSCGTTMAPAGSLVLSTRAPIGHLAVANLPVCTNQGCRCLVPHGDADIRFHYYVMFAARPELQSHGQGSTFLELSRAKLASFRIPSVPLPEQRAIADFLDRETARIDALISKKERLIELLNEKRTAVISHAVTKGLDPTVPMKDSGVEWLGQIPAHWEVKRLKFVSKDRLTNGLFKTKDCYGNGTLLVNVYDIYRDDFSLEYAALERLQATAQEIECYRVKQGDVFLVRSSLKQEGVGASACALTPISEPVVFECHLIRLRPDQTKVSPAFLINFLNSNLTRQRLVALSETVTMTTLGQPKLSTVEVAVPPVDEQHEIAALLQQRTVAIADTVDKARMHIALLREYRTALISAAVTGKIDVREED